MTLRIVPLYPELLSIYADRGNVCVLEQRARWRGLPVEVVPLALGESFDPDQADVVLIGGGQDRDQALVAEALIAQVPALRSAIADGVPVLAVCGGYQLLGHRYVDQSGRHTPGTGLVDLETHAGSTRLVGNVVAAVEATAADGRIFVLATYTAMLDLHGVLADRGLTPRFWQEQV